MAAHIQVMQQKQDELVSQARPPQVVLEAADLKAVKLGAGLNKAYAAALRRGKGQNVSPLEQAKAAVEDYLMHFPPEQLGTILLGALASVYGKEDSGVDTAVWLTKSEIESNAISVASQTIQTLRSLGLLDDLLFTKEGLIIYPRGLDAEERS